MNISDAILKAQRLATPIKLIGFAFLIVHCVTTDIRFNPIWVFVYVAVALAIVNACMAVGYLVDKIHPPKKTEPDASSFTAEERRCVGHIITVGQNMRARPWKFLLIAGEDGFFFLPLLYIGITVPAVIAASVLFAAMHYRLKPSSSLADTFLFSSANALIVLPHGILPMVIGHLVLDVTVFSLVPTLKRWVEENQQKNQMPNQASDATSEPAPGAASSAHQG